MTLSAVKGVNWRMTPLASLCSLYNGRAFRTSEWESLGLPIVRIRNLTKPSSPFNYFSGLVSKKHAIDTNTVLISWAGTPKTSFGAFLWDRGPAVLNQHIHKVEFKSSDCDPQYFVYAVNWKLREVARRFKGGVGLKHITKKELNTLEIPMPWRQDGSISLHAQQRLATQLRDCLDDVAQAKSLVAEMRDDALKLLPSAISRVREQLQDIAPVALQTHFHAFNGRASGEGNSAVRVFKTKHVYPHRLKLDRPSFLKTEQQPKLPEMHYLKVGDIVMANMAEGTLGRVSFVEQCEPNWTVDSQVTIIRAEESHDLSLARWVYYYLWSSEGQRAIQSVRKGIRFAENRGQTHISPMEILRIKFPMPSRTQRLQITSWLDSIRIEAEQITTFLDENATLIEEAERALIDRTFRGVNPHGS